jgi:hypothetical protein
VLPEESGILSRFLLVILSRIIEGSMRKQDPVQRSGNFIKGKLGENIIMRLLRDLDFQVFPNGYEVTHPALITLMNRKQIDGKQIKKYRMRADFTVLKEANDKQKSLFSKPKSSFALAVI